MGEKRFVGRLHENHADILVWCARKCELKHFPESILIIFTPKIPVIIQVITKKRQKANDMNEKLRDREKENVCLFNSVNITVFQRSRQIRFLHTKTLLKKK